MNHHERPNLHPCFLLHRRPYSNTSLLLECFSRDRGRLPAIAKGVRSKGANLAGVLQPFRELLLTFSGRGEVLTLHGVEARDQRLALSGRSVFCGFYLNELLTRLLQRYDPHEDLFADYREALHGLHSGANIERCLRRFELRLLHSLGYGVCLDTDAMSGEAVRRERSYRYEIEQGVIGQASEAVSGELIRGETLLALAHDDDLDAFGQREARALLRRILAHYLGDKPLKSRELFRPTGDVKDYERNQ